MTRKEDTTEERWKALKEVILKETEVVVGYQKGLPPRKPWVTKEMIQDMEERRKWKRQSTEKAKQEYRKLNNKLRRTTEKEREQWWWGEQCQELEEMQKMGRYDKVYEKVKKMTSKKTSGKGIAVQDKAGVLLQDLREVRGRWKEYVEDLYQSKNRPIEITEELTKEVKEDLGPDILREEVLSAIKEMNNNKTEGIDSIPAEVLKSLGEKAVNELIELCQDIYRTGNWPEDFLQTIMIPIK